MLNLFAHLSNIFLVFAIRPGGFSISW